MKRLKNKNKIRNVGGPKPRLIFPAHSIPPKEVSNSTSFPTHNEKPTVVFFIHATKITTATEWHEAWEERNYF